MLIDSTRLSKFGARVETSERRLVLHLPKSTAHMVYE